MSLLRHALIALTVAALTAGLAVQASGDTKSKSWRSPEAVKARTAPVGQVYVEGDEIPNPAPAVTAAASGPRTGEQVYNGACMACHAAGVAGAPKFGDKATWAPRIKTSEEALWNSLVHGKNAMPPKGMCMDCSDDELKEVLAYVIEHGK